MTTALEAIAKKSKDCVIRPNYPSAVFPPNALSWDDKVLRLGLFLSVKNYVF